MEKATESMIRNLQENTGKSMEEWIAILNEQALTRTSEKVDFLKTKHNLGHGYAGLIVYQAKVAAAGKVDSPEELLAKQFIGKENLKPIYDKILEEVRKFGDDVEVVPRNSYVSLRRNVQFAMLTPATKIRFDVALKFKEVVTDEILEALPTPGMCTHRIKLHTVEDISEKVIFWLKASYDRA